MLQPDNIYSAASRQAMDNMMFISQNFERTNKKSEKNQQLDMIQEKISTAKTRTGTKRRSISKQGAPNVPIGLTIPKQASQSIKLRGEEMSKSMHLNQRPKRLASAVISKRN